MRPGIHLQLKSTFSRRRVARSLSGILVLTLIQVGIGAVIPSAAQAATAAAGTPCASTVTNAATVSDISTSAYCILKFTSGANDWVAPVGVTNVSLLIVGGGGGGGGGRGGGGGAGGFFEKTVHSVSESASYAITVGAGGAGNVGNGNNGGASLFSDITIAGGGGGAGAGVTPVNVTGASAGGAGFNYETNQPIGGTSTAQTVSGVSVLSNSGAAPACTATNTCVDSTRNTGGGGGAGSAGIGGAGGDNKGGYNNGSFTVVGTRPNGGNGVQTSFTGTTEYFAAGGGGSTGIHYGEWGGGNYVTATYGLGGNSIGGNGGYATSTSAGVLATAGATNTGSGGGGGACSPTTGLAGAAGGSGVVIIKWVKPITTTSIADQSAAVSQQVTFTYSRTAVAAGITATRVWQISTDSGVNWSTVNYATDSANETLTVPAVNLSHSGRLFRSKITLTNNNITTIVYTNNAQLTVFTAPGSDTDTALTFNGSSQYAWAPDEPTFDITGAITFEAWVNPSSITSGQWNFVLIKDGAYQFGIGTSGTWAYGLTGSSVAAGISTGITAKINEWHHIAFTRASGTNEVKFYYDGYLAYVGTADGASTGLISDSSSVLSIGRRTSDGRYFAGQIDQIALFDSVRNQSTIASDMHSYLSTSTLNLKAYYDFNEGVSNRIYNRVYSSYEVTNLTFVGTSIWKDVKQVDTSSVYTTIYFPRTYLTSSGGWRTPGNVKQVSTVVVAGGGGGNGETDGSGWMSGGGGAGGYVFSTTAVTPNSVSSLTVGQGGRRGKAIAVQDAITQEPLNGQNSTFLSLSAIGGGSGGGRHFNGDPAEPGASGGSGGGGGTYSSSGGSGTSGQGSSGGTAYSSCCSAGGGGGAGGNGGNGGTNGGAAGDGVLNPLHIANLSEQYLAAGGAGGSLYGTHGSVGTKGGVAFNQSAKANSGSGGGGGGGGSQNYYDGGYGGSGVIIVRWITAEKPTYTKPSIAYLNAGMTETFTTNVVSDSATAVLTRTFRWESTTPTSNGAYSLIKQGTGASNAAFSWIPPDSRTSGSGFLYRLIVTDSDTAGLFITDSSTTYAVINDALVVSGNALFGKTINLSKSESFTISLGTPTYRATLTSINSGITLDTSTAGVAVIKILETMTVGTYYETLTVTDSVSASVITPLTIVVASPPSFSATGEQIDQGTVLNVDFGNSNSFTLSGTSISDISGRKLTGNIANKFSSSATYLNGSTRTSTYMNNLSCETATVSSEYLGYVYFDGSLDCGLISGLGLLKKYTAQSWVKRNGAQNSWTSFVCTPYFVANDQINVCLFWLTSTAMVAGMFDGNNWFYTASTEVPDNTWVFASATYETTTSTAGRLRLIINGDASTAKTGDVTSFNWDAAKLSPHLLLGRKWDTANYFKGSLATIRIYDRVLSDTEILQNYNSTKDRFLVANIDKSYPSQKYGTTSTETYTATSGYGSRSFSYTTGNKSGVTWTATGSDTVLKLQETLTATTHYDTITVTDSLGASTYLPLKMVISKADTLTISMDTATTVVYSGAPITVYPKPYFKGLIAGDSLTVSTRFTSSTYTDSATVPTDVDTYTVVAANPVFSVGALSNYVNVIYETSTAKVTQANQSKLSINLYGAIAGSPFLIQTSGGAGDGLVTESVTAGSTATGCAVSNHILSNTSPSTQQLTCNILVTKAASKNYKVETLTATVYFMLYVNNMPTNQVGSGSTIGLNGINSVWVDPGAAPTITGPGAGTYAANSPITITGTGFSLGPITVKFERNQLGTNIAVASDTSMTVTIPAGARSGLFSVTNMNGTEFSSFTITIG